jgi:hypothetical protein
MSDTDVTTVNPVDISNAGDPVVVLASDDIETIVVNEQGPPGPQGPAGPIGPQGVPGNTVLYGPTDPSSVMGIDGNFYINTTTHMMFGPKSGGAWPAGVSLIGPQGIPGNTLLYGAGPPAAGTGVDGNFYIDTTAHFLYGPKAAGAWPAGTSLVGPQGPQGIQGIQGPPGAVPEAPTDGQVYGRSNSAWTPITGGGVGAGTVMLFYQAAAPTGWTKLTTQNDKALRVVSGAGGVSGGTNAFSTVMAQTVVGSDTPNITKLASHNHTDSGFTDFVFVATGGGGGYGPSTGLGSGPMAATGGSASHNHTIQMSIQYIDLILASKN